MPVQPPAETPIINPRSVTRPDTGATDARDEAFASASESDWRRDESHNETAPGPPPAPEDAPSTDDLSTVRLTETLRSQLVALDAQCRDLARLLDTLG